MDPLVRGVDDLTPGRARAILLAQLPSAIETGQRAQRDRERGQNSLFGSLEDTAGTTETMRQPVPVCEAWDDREVLAAEKESLGFYVTGHPLQRYADEVAAMADATTRQLGSASSRKEIAVAGMVNSIRDLKTKNGDAMAVLQIEDIEGQAEVVIFPKVYRTCHRHLVVDAVLLFRGRPENNDDGPRMLASEISSFDQVARRQQEQAAQSVEIEVDLGRAEPELAETLCGLLEKHRGAIPVVVDLCALTPDGFRARLTPSSYLCVDPTRGLVQEVEALLGPGSVRLRS
jgi:DNA polymerase-3 subunit alpha